MSVTTPETFKLSGGSVTANHTQIVDALGASGYAATYSSGVITITLPSSTWRGKDFEFFLRLANSIRATFKYTKAS